MENTLQDAMASAGLFSHKPIDIPANGKIVRFRVEGDKAGSRNGWAVLNATVGAGFFGAFGNWKTGESHAWNSPSGQPKTFAERLENKQRSQALRDSIIKTSRLWGRARPD